MRSGGVEQLRSLPSVQSLLLLFRFIVTAAAAALLQAAAALNPIIMSSIFAPGFDKTISSKKLYLRKNRTQTQDDADEKAHGGIIKRKEGPPPLRRHPYRRHYSLEGVRALC
jgi:hypothetical protein